VSDRAARVIGGDSLARHLARGAVGFGLIGAALALTQGVGAAALLLVLPGMVALGGCPTCWLVGLVQTLSTGRLRGDCGENGCSLRASPRDRAPG
jgi:hypothetical protein